MLVTCVQLDTRMQGQKYMRTCVTLHLSSTVCHTALIITWLYIFLLSMYNYVYVQEMHIISAICVTVICVT